jgi:hypothetical protein
MSDLRMLGLGGGGSLPADSEPGREHVMVQRPLKRVLAFTGRSIDEVVNDPIAKREILGYYKLYKQVQRGCEVVDLERWWNPLW